ncbi:tetratricopeptide repeat protein [Cyanothece sp. BG0011]|uniref:tetratricopeptide repeat protein n=1 Tax=Cyanothece sp. BG0011 TaxID=2082950 RepID=UPI000D1F05B7|nr:tetratricopeptide repeat protein [Cyanothece sp. BG0011]
MSIQLTSLEIEAQQALNEQQYQAAISLYHQCLETKSDRLEDYWYLGLAYFLNKQEEEAQEAWMMPLLSGELDHHPHWEQELIIILDSAIERLCSQGNLITGKRLQQVIQEIDPNYEHSKLTITIQSQVKQLLEEGLLAVVEKNLEEGKQKFLEIIELDDNLPHVWHNLGMLYYQLEAYPQAYQAIQKALELNPNKSVYYYGLGLILEDVNRTELAIAAYQKCLELDPKHLDTYICLGRMLKREKRWLETEQVYQQAIANIPDHFGCYLNLGNLLLEQAKLENICPPTRFKDIINYYKKALELSPNDHSVLLGLAETYQLAQEEELALLHFGDAAFICGDYESAIDYYHQYIQKDPHNLKVYCDLFKTYEKLKNYDQAIEVGKKGIELEPKSHQMYKLLIYLYHSLGDIEAALTIIAKAEEAIPGNSLIKQLKQWLLPIIYDTPDEIERYRQRFTDHLYEFIDSSGIDQPEQLTTKKIAQLTNSLAQHTNFYLQYQGRDDKPIQKKYGEYVHKVLSLRFPQYVQPRSLEPGLPNRKLRIGYLSASMYYHTVGRLFLGWLKQADRDKFTIHSYAINKTSDVQTEKFQVLSDSFHHIPTYYNLSEVAETILKDKLDILVFPDVGMTPMMTLLAGLRLAPIQCVSWGHPITTGSPTMDYFLTSDLMEPENGEDHYTEKLIRLPNISIAYETPSIPDHPNPRETFNLSDEAVVYLSCQSLYKYLPQYDYIFPRIALEVPNAQFAFLESSNSPKITQQFKNRLKRAFADVGLDSEQYCVIVPRLNRHEYLSLNLVSDVFLDTLSWSGGNTTLEAIACNLPVVTCPGEFMRGRHAYAILKTLGVEETITYSEEDYIAMAIKLGHDPQWRKELRENIKANHHRLYEDQVAMDALESFYEQAVKDHQAKES